ncbi:MAG: hypothetical protein HY821_03555 [Acidobacteria bacterium]|nr:hypothetical protein [Acidobacteriota bacterium]
MTAQMQQCAAEIQSCWRQCDTALSHGDAEGANQAFGRVFEVVDTFPALIEEDVWALRFLCVLTWVKVAAALETTGQADSAHEAQEQVFSLLDELIEPLDAGRGLKFASGLETEEAADLVGRLYLLCSKAGRQDTLLWGRCFMDFDRKARGEEAPPRVN